MKKVLSLFILTTFFTCCEVGVRESNAKYVSNEYRHDAYEVHETKLIKDEIEYYIYHTYEGGLHVINHTKELLEVELLKIQIDSLKSL